MEIQWICKAFYQLSLDELFDMMALRQKVFVVEQDCPYQDADEKDKDSLHLFGMDSEGNLMACLRIVPKGLSYADYIAIGRVVVDPAYRGKKLGEKMMAVALEEIENREGRVAVKISAQSHLKRFYESFGFQQIGEGYLEDNIPHIAMIR